MSSVVIAGDTSGTVTLDAPAVAGSTVLNLPTISGGTLVTTDSAGNVGIGVTPSAWLSTRTAVELRSPGSGVVGISNGNVQLSSNIYSNTSGNNTYGINGSGVIAVCAATSGEFNIFTAPSGTAGTTATLTTALVVENGGNLRFNSGYGSAAVAYGCRAWVNFNGTGTVAIRASGNVSSITDNGTGDYTVNFTTAMPDVNYAFQGSVESNTGSDQRALLIRNGGMLSSSSRIVVKNDANGFEDCPVVAFSVFR
jgi:hypothetical protein